MSENDKKQHVLRPSSLQTLSRIVPFGLAFFGFSLLYYKSKMFGYLMPATLTGIIWAYYLIFFCFFPTKVILNEIGFRIEGFGKNQEFSWNQIAGTFGRFVSAYGTDGFTSSIGFTVIGHKQLFSAREANLLYTHFLPNSLGRRQGDIIKIMNLMLSRYRDGIISL